MLFSNGPELTLTQSTVAFMSTLPMRNMCGDRCIDHYGDLLCFVVF